MTPGGRVELSAGQGRRDGGGQAEVRQDAPDHARLSDQRDPAEVPSTPRVGYFLVKK